MSLLCQVLVLMICAWAAGFTVDSISRRTFAVSAICCFLPCLFCLLRFRQESLPRFCLLLFLFPAIAGVCFSRRGGQSTGAGLSLWLWSNNLHGCTGSSRTPVGAQLGIDCARVVYGHYAVPA